MQTRKVLAVAALLLAVVLWVLLGARREGLDDMPVAADTEERNTIKLAPKQAGGRRARPRRYPYIVQFSDKTGPYCTGFLISPTKVLTAAHCIEGVKLSDIQMRIGAYSKFGTDGESRAVKSVYIPPERSTSKLDKYDYAIVTLWTPSTKTPIKVDGLNADVRSGIRIGTEVWSAGFGRKMYGYNPKRLQENALRLTTTTTSVLYSYTDEKKAGFASNYRRACSGDSGAPIFLRGRTPSEDVAIGIHVSGGKDKNGQCSPEIKTESAHVRLSYVVDTSRNKLL